MRSLIQPKWPICGGFTQQVCSLMTTPPQVAASPPPNGGNRTTRTTTRRRHADSQPLVLQNPPPQPTSCAALHPRPAQGELFRARTHIRPSRATNIALPPGSAAHPVQNSPSTPQNTDFGPFCVSRENFVPFPPPTRRAGRKKSRTNTPPHPSNAPLPQFRMQFDWVKIQQGLKTL